MEKVVLEMLMARGHVIENVTKNQIDATSDVGGKVLVIILNDKFTIKLLEDLLGKYNINEYYEFIVVCKHIMISNLKKIENICEKIEIFNENELSLNIINHVLQPKFRKIESNKKGTWPILLETDPVAKFLKFKNGDFIEITHPNGLISYRIVRSIK